MSIIFNVFFTFRNTEPTDKYNILLAFLFGMLNLMVVVALVFFWGKGSKKEIMLYAILSSFVYTLFVGGFLHFSAIDLTSIELNHEFYRLYFDRVHNERYYTKYRVLGILMDRSNGVSIRFSRSNYIKEILDTHGFVLRERRLGDWERIVEHLTQDNSPTQTSKNCLALLRRMLWVKKLPIPNDVLKMLYKAPLRDPLGTIIEEE